MQIQPTELEKLSNLLQNQIFVIGYMEEFGKIQQNYQKQLSKLNMKYISQPAIGDDLSLMLRISATDIQQLSEKLQIGLLNLAGQHRYYSAIDKSLTAARKNYSKLQLQIQNAAEKQKEVTKIKTELFKAEGALLSFQSQIPVIVSTSVRFHQQLKAVLDKYWSADAGLNQGTKQCPDIGTLTLRRFQLNQLTAE